SATVMIVRPCRPSRPSAINRTEGSTEELLSRQPAHRSIGPSPARSFAGGIREGLKGGSCLEAAHELARVRREGAPLGAGDRLARDELLAERIDEVAVLRDAIVQMWPRRQPGGPDVADHLPLRDATAGTDAG